MVPVTTWLAPVFLVRCLRVRLVRRGLLFGLLVHGVAFGVWFGGNLGGR